MPEQIVQVPLFEQMAAELRQSGIFQCDLTGQDIAGIMRGVVESLVSGQDAVRASIANMNVVIEKQEARFFGSVSVEKANKCNNRV